MTATVPASRIEPVVETLHGEEVADPYRWLEEDDTEATRAWTEAQNRYTAAILDRLPGRDALRERLSRLMRAGFAMSPRTRGGRRQITIATAGRLERILDAAARRGRIARRLPIHYTEFGFQTDPPDG